MRPLIGLTCIALALASCKGDLDSGEETAAGTESGSGSASGVTSGAGSSGPGASTGAASDGGTGGATAGTCVGPLDIFGHQDVGAEVVSGLSGTIQGSRFDVPCDGTLDKVYVYVQTNAPLMHAGVYTDSGGKPGTLISDTASDTASPGWKELDAYALPVTAGPHWVLFQASDDAPFHTYDVGVDGDGYEATLPFGDLPTVFPGGQPTDRIWSVYFTMTVE